MYTRSASLLALLLTQLANPALAADLEVTDDGQVDPGPGFEQYLQVWLGGLDTDDGWTRTDEQTGEELTGDFGTLPYLGGGAQRLWGNAAQIGFEGGGLVTFKNDSTKFAGTNGRLFVAIDNTLISVDFFMGGVVSVRPFAGLRIYGALGPTAAYAYLDDDDDDEGQVAPTGNVTAASGRNLELGSSGHSLSITLYGRAGFEFETPGGLTFGAQARYAPHEFDFDEGGELELDEVTYFLTIGQRM